jgi:DNA polymerase-3 subunit alpha
MTAESGDIETCSEYIAEANRMGYKVLPPDINESFSDFTVVVENGKVTGNIRFGLLNVKNFGAEIGKAVIAERREHGPFTSMEDFLERVQHRNMNKKSLEALIMCGAMDEFGDRGIFCANIEHLLAFHKGIGQFSNGGQGGLFDNLVEKPKSVLHLDEATPATMEQKLVWEKELLGLYVSGHPLDAHSEKMKKATTTIAALLKKKFDKNQLLVAHIDLAKVIMTKKDNSKMAFLTIQDKSGIAEAVIFPEAFKKIGSLVKEGIVAAMKCSVAERGDKVTIMIEDIRIL